MKPNRICVVCKTQFHVPPYKIRQNIGKFCSTACKKKFTVPPEIRFWGGVNKDGPFPEGRSDIGRCWLWTRSTSGPKGGCLYGQFFVNGKHIKAHRYSWVICFGEIPKGLFVLHRCDVPLCVNPEHLFLGTQRDNVDDMMEKKRHTFGEVNGRAKITESDVRLIRKLVGDGHPPSRVADSFGISGCTVSHIMCGRTWSHVQ